MKTTTILNEPLVTSAEAARLIGWTECTLRRKRSQGQDSPAFVEIGKFRMYRPSAIEAWIESHTRTPVEI